MPESKGWSKAKSIVKKAGVAAMFANEDVVSEYLWLSSPVVQVLKSQLLLSSLHPCCASDCNWSLGFETIALFNRYFKRSAHSLLYHFADLLVRCWSKYCLSTNSFQQSAIFNTLKDTGALIKDLKVCSPFLKKKMFLVRLKQFGLLTHYTNLLSVRSKITRPQGTYHAMLHYYSLPIPSDYILINT